MAYLITSCPMTLTDFQGRAYIEGLLKCDYRQVMQQSTRLQQTASRMVRER